MNVSLKLPGRSLASDLALARGAVDLAVRHLHGTVPAQQAPAGTTNKCEDEGCLYLGEIVDDQGKRWLVYECEGMITAYPA